MSTDLRAARTLVTGGLRSGKSRYAEALLDREAPAVYVTPGYPPDPTTDAEWADRVAAHRARRPAQWSTLETLDLAAAITAADSPVLIDCLGTWVSRLIDSWGVWDEPAGQWRQRFDDEVAALTTAIAARAQVVLVTNEVGWGLVSTHRSGRVFADHLGRVNQAVAATCDEVILMVAGRPLALPR